MGVNLKSLKLMNNKEYGKPKTGLLKGKIYNPMQK